MRGYRGSGVNLHMKRQMYSAKTRDRQNKNVSIDSTTSNAEELNCRAPVLVGVGTLLKELEFVVLIESHRKICWIASAHSHAAPLRNNRHGSCPVLSIKKIG